MNRFHVHISVKNLDESIRFYSKLFGAEPSVSKPDYAKWMLDDPRVNFAISHNACGSAVGLNHLGLQVDSGTELASLEERFAQAGLSGVAEHGTACCYAKSDKTWLQDPQGIAWESFHTLDSVPVFGGQTLESSGNGGSCTPDAVASPSRPQSSCGPKAAPNCCG